MQAARRSSVSRFLDQPCGQPAEYDLAGRATMLSALGELPSILETEDIMS